MIAAAKATRADLVCNIYLTLYLIETPYNTFANRSDPDQTCKQIRQLL